MRGSVIAPGRPLGPRHRAGATRSAAHRLAAQSERLISKMRLQLPLERGGVLRPRGVLGINNAQLARQGLRAFADPHLPVHAGLAEGVMGADLAIQPFFADYLADASSGWVPVPQ